MGPPLFRPMRETKQALSDTIPCDREFRMHGKSIEQHQHKAIEQCPKSDSISTLPMKS